MNTTEFLTQVIPIKDKNLKNILEKECRINLFKQGEAINKVGEIDLYVRFLIFGVVRGDITDEKNST